MASTKSVPKAATVANHDCLQPKYTTGQSLQEFFKFAKCAPELQDLIWEWTCVSTPSVIRIRINRETVKYVNPLPDIPAVLHATSGSRGIALKYFQVVENKTFDREVPRSVGPHINLLNQLFTVQQPNLNPANALTAQQYMIVPTAPVLVASVGPMLAANLPTTPPPPQMAPLGFNNFHSTATPGTGFNIAATAANAVMFQTQAPAPINLMLPMNPRANLSAQARNAAFGVPLNGLNHNNNGAALGNGIAPANLANYNLNSLNLSNLPTSFNVPIHQAQGLVNQAQGVVNQAQGVVNQVYGVANQAQGTVNQAQGLLNQAQGAINRVRVRCRASRHALAGGPIQKFYFNSNCDIFMLQVGDGDEGYAYPEFRLSQDSSVLRPKLMTSHFEKQRTIAYHTAAWNSAEPKPFPTAGKLPVVFERIQNIVFKLVLPVCPETLMSGPFKAWVKTCVDNFCDNLVSPTMTKLPELESCDFFISGGGRLAGEDRVMLKELKEAPVTESDGLTFGAAELSVVYLALKDWFFCKYLDTMKDGSKLMEPRIVGWVPECVKRMKY